MVEAQSLVGLNIFLCLGSSQQHKKNEARINMITMNPITILQITTGGEPQMIFGEPASIGGHIRAVKVTDCWYSPVDVLSTLFGPKMNGYV